MNMIKYGLYLTIVGGLVLAGYGICTLTEPLIAKLGFTAALLGLFIILLGLSKRIGVLND